MKNSLAVLENVKALNLTDVADQGPYRPTDSDGLREVFTHMWSRLNQAAFMAEMLALHEPGSDGAKQTLAALQQVANVSEAYSHMQKLLGTTHH
ncbi:hypothetical protein [Xanthomonas campestris]|uniref:hypothetical protein n=1 Tax=Xanthomonas campestris TaxID=339 RepID=UPI002367929B|nr:hypothetical protein [Xanthomonas campestris]WDI91915.1 hypothetical protein JH280_11255 [Xanthomonas campestris]